MKSNVYICVVVMAVVTYLIRMLPLAVIKRKIENPILRSFLFYVPYVTLSVMVFPAILLSTGNTVSAIVGFAVALAVSIAGKSLPVTALLSVVSVFITEIFI